MSDSANTPATEAELPLTRMDDDWVRKAIQANPCRAIENGEFTTCPLRLSFIYAHEKPKQKDGSDGKFGAAGLFQAPGNDVGWLMEHGGLGILAAAYNAKHMEAYGKPPEKKAFKDQKEKAQYRGFQPGLPFISTSSQFPVMVVERDPASTPANPRQRLITDPKRLFAGLWGMLTVKPYSFGKGYVGVAWGISSIYVLCEDYPFAKASGAPDPTKQFAGIDVSIIPNMAAGGVSPEALF